MSQFAEEKRKLFTPQLGIVVEDIFLDSLYETKEIFGDKANKRKKVVPVVPRLAKKKKVVADTFTLVEQPN